MYYEVHNWNICGDLKAIWLLLGLQTGYAKHTCFLSVSVEVVEMTVARIKLKFDLTKLRKSLAVIMCSIRH